MTASLNKLLDNAHTSDDRLPTVSVGSATASIGDDIDLVIRRADATMYRNKRERKASR